MEIGVGLDHTLGMNWDDQANLAREAAELGYESIWTPENIGTDSFQVCAPPLAGQFATSVEGRPDHRHRRVAGDVPHADRFSPCPAAP